MLMIILKNLDTQNVTTSSKQDYLDHLLDQETNNNCMNTQDGTLKNVSWSPLTPLQPVAPSNLINLNLSQLLALLQNSIQNQPSIDPFLATLPDSGHNKVTVDSTSKNSKGNRDSDEEEDKLLQNLLQEFECQEERGSPKFYRIACGVFSRKRNLKR